MKPIEKIIYFESGNGIQTLSLRASFAATFAEMDSVTGQIFLLDENFLRFFFKAAMAVRPIKCNDFGVSYGCKNIFRVEPIHMFVWNLYFIHRTDFPD